MTPQSCPILSTSIQSCQPMIAVGQSSPSPEVKEYKTSWACQLPQLQTMFLRRLQCPLKAAGGLIYWPRREDLSHAPTPLYFTLLSLLLHNTYHPYILCLLIVHHVVVSVTCLLSLVYNLHGVKDLSLVP